MNVYAHSLALGFSSSFFGCDVRYSVCATPGVVWTGGTMDSFSSLSRCVLAFLGGRRQNLPHRQDPVCLREEGEEQVRGPGGRAAPWASRSGWPSASASSPGPFPCFPPQGCGALGGDDRLFILATKEKNEGTACRGQGQAGLSAPPLCHSPSLVTFPGAPAPTLPTG